MRGDDLAVTVTIDGTYGGAGWKWEVRAFGHVPDRGVTTTRLEAVDRVVRALEDLVGRA